MTSMTQTDGFALVDAHLESIKPAHQAAFDGPVVRDYAVGAIVWMWDHYNTAVIVGPGVKAGTWDITTTDADGSTSSYRYSSGQLRPAVEPVEFRW